jgi:tetratricopeptide (TPR) repeat protein
MAFTEKQPDAALERVKRQIALVPDSPRLYEELGRVHAARKEADLAEEAYLKALKLDPRMFGTYLKLASLYAAAGKYDRALARLDEALRVNPKNLVALMVSGMVYQQKGETAKAQQAYERALAVDPRFAPAANNLAWIYSEHGGDKEKALQLAQTAKQGLPDEPSISDTLGWILYKRGVYQRALSLLKESATKMPANAEVQYHLGMTYHKLGDKAAAKQALAQALKLSSGFPGVEEAKRTLAEIS